MTPKICEKVVYVRVSKDEQNTDNQKARLLKEGIPSDCIFIDKGISGTVPAMKRAGFRRMMEHIEKNQGAVKYLYVWELSRIGRSMLETLTIIQKLESTHGVKIWSLSETEAFTRNEDSNIRNLLISIIAWVAEQERNNISARTRLALEKAEADGTVLGRPRRKITDEEWEKVEEMRQANKNWREIARALKIPPSTLSRHRKQAGRVDEDEKRGRPPKETASGGD